MGMPDPHERRIQDLEQQMRTAIATVERHEVVLTEVRRREDEHYARIIKPMMDRIDKLAASQDKMAKDLEHELAKIRTRLAVIVAGSASLAAAIGTAGGAVATAALGL